VQDGFDATHVRQSVATAGLSDPHLDVGAIDARRGAHIDELQLLPDRVVAVHAPRVEGEHRRGERAFGDGDGDLVAVSVGVGEELPGEGGRRDARFEEFDDRIRFHDGLRMVGGAGRMVEPAGSAPGAADESARGPRLASGEKSNGDAEISIFPCALLLRKKVAEWSRTTSLLRWRKGSVKHS
jgi:hypothetical protein